MLKYRGRDSSEYHLRGAQVPAVVHVPQVENNWSIAYRHSALVYTCNTVVSYSHSAAIDTLTWSQGEHYIFALHAKTA